MQRPLEYPREFFYPIEKNDDLELLLTVGIDQKDDSFWVECLIVLKENKTIFRSVGKKYNLQDESLAISEGMRLYRSYLRM